MVTEMTHPALSDLASFAADVKTLYGLLSKVGPVCAFVLQFVAPIAPPWPDYKTVTFIVGVFAMLLFFGAFALRNWQPSAKQHAQISIGATVVFVASLIAYLSSWSAFVVIPKDGPKEIFITGFRLKSDEILREWVKANPLDLTSERLLRKFEWNPEHIWTIGSLTTMRMMLLATWVIACTSPIVALLSLVHGGKAEPPVKGQTAAGIGATSN